MSKKNEIKEAEQPKEAKQKQEEIKPRKRWSQFPELIVEPYIPSYCEERMISGNADEGIYPIGLTDKENMFCVRRGELGWKWMPTFSMDDAETSVGLEKDGIRCLVTNLDRELITYDKSDNSGQPTGEIVPYYIMRFNEYWFRKCVKTTGGHKYQMPKYSDGAIVPYPFLSPKLIEKWESGEFIDTLVLTESCINSQLLCMRGLYAVGFGSWKAYSNRTEKEMYRDVLRIIHDCKVKNVVILLDGDCRDIDEKDIKEGKSLESHPREGLETVKRVRKQLMQFRGTGIYMAYPKTNELPDKMVTIDQMLLSGKLDERKVIEELSDVETPSGLFKKFDARNQEALLPEQFNLGEPEDFYRVWRHKIGTARFSFYGTMYQWNEKEGKLIVMLNLSLKNFIAVGNDFYEIINHYYARDPEHPEKEIVKRDKKMIEMRFKKTVDNPCQQIVDCNYYDSFCVYPDHFDYKEVVNGMYNLYHRLPYQAQEGQCPHILWLMHHIFQEQYEYGMDYVQEIIHDPMQMLPILCLVSAEGKTGKSTFLTFMCELVGANGVTVGSKELQAKFNGMFAGKLIVGCDETALSDTPEFTERLKYWSTAPKVSSEKKNQDAYMVDNFVKLILVSNDETGFAYVSDREARFWIIKVPQIPKDQNIPDVMPILRKEIPAFMYLLQNRTMHQPKSLDRMYFRPEDIETDAIKKLKDNSLPKAIRAIRNYMRQYFITTHKESVFMTVRLLMDHVDGLSVACKGDNETCRKYLTDPKWMAMSPYIRPQDRVAQAKYVKFEKVVYNVTQEENSDTATFHYENKTDTGIAYEFMAKDFLTEDELKQYVTEVLY